MNGITKAIAIASASGRYFKAVTIVAMPTICRIVRTNVRIPTRLLIRHARLGAGADDVMGHLIGQ